LDLKSVLVEESGERIGLLPGGETLFGPALSFEYVPKAHEQVEILRSVVDPVRFFAGVCDPTLEARELGSARRVTDGVTGSIGEAAPKALELGQEAVGLRIALARSSELKATLLQVGHGARRRASLAEDAGRKEQFAHLVSSDCLGACELCQVDGEHSPKQRLVGTAERQAQLLLGASSSIWAPDGKLSSRRAVAFDPPLPGCARLDCFLAKC
jgi:hypothetical protein